jgi:hypothetical protein
MCEITSSGLEFFLPQISNDEIFNGMVEDLDNELRKKCVHAKYVVPQYILSDIIVDPQTYSDMMKWGETAEL